MGRLAQAQPVGSGLQRIDAQTMCDRIKEHVAGLLDAAMKVDMPMAALPPAMKDVVSEGNGAGTVHAEIGCDRAGVERCERDRGLEG